MTQAYLCQKSSEEVQQIQMEGCRMVTRFCQSTRRMFVQHLKSMHRSFSRFDLFLLNYIANVYACIKHICVLFQIVYWLHHCCPMVVSFQSCTGSVHLEVARFKAGVQNSHRCQVNCFSCLLGINR